MIVHIFSELLESRGLREIGMMSLCLMTFDGIFFFSSMILLSLSEAVELLIIFSIL